MVDSSRHRINSAGALLIMLLAGMLSGCSSDSGEEILARVNGVKITGERFTNYYRPGIKDDRPFEEELQVLEDSLDDLIGYILIQEAGRAEGLHKTRDFRRHQEVWEKELLNRLVKQREIVERTVVSEAAIDSMLAHSAVERHVQHIIVLNAQAADLVKKDLEASRPWDQVAVEYSRDNTVSMHKGDLGWIQYGDKPFNIYPDIQEKIFNTPVGSWTGPIQTSGEYHFIKVLAERERATAAPAQERARARELLSKSMRQKAEQEFANRMWERGGYSVNEDNLGWLVERILESFRRDPANNPVPVLTAEDEKRIVIRSDTHPYTAQMLLDRLELINPQGRDSALDVSDWRNLIITEWVITDEVAAYARQKGYDRDPGYLSELKKYIDGQLYARESQKIEDSVPVPSDEDLERYRATHPEEFDIPERRSIMEVLVATREEADDILSQAKAGEDLEEFAVERTIRGEAYKQRGGRFAPIRRSEFGPLGEAVFETPVGDLGPVVETPLGFSVFRVLRSFPPQTISLDSIRESLRQRLLNEGRKAAEESTIQRLRENGSVKIDEEFLREFARRAIAAAQQYKQRTSAPDSVASPDGGGVGR